MVLNRVSGKFINQAMYIDHKMYPWYKGVYRPKERGPLNCSNCLVLFEKQQVVWVSLRHKKECCDACFKSFVTIEALV